MKEIIISSYHSLDDGLLTHHTLLLELVERDRELGFVHMEDLSDGSTEAN